MNHEQADALFKRWLALDTDERTAVFSGTFGRMQGRLEIADRTRRTAAIEFMRAVEKTISEIEATKDA